MSAPWILNRFTSARSLGLACIGAALVIACRGEGATAPATPSFAVTAGKKGSLYVVDGGNTNSVLIYRLGRRGEHLRHQRGRL